MDNERAIYTVVYGSMVMLFERLNLFGVLALALSAFMVMDFFTALAASKIEKQNDPNSTEKGWQSRKGIKGILKKVGYIALILVCLITDMVIRKLSLDLGFAMPTSMPFSIIVTMYLAINEMISILENITRMGVNVPSWVEKLSDILMIKVNKAGDKAVETLENNLEDKC